MRRVQWNVIACSLSGTGNPRKKSFAIKIRKGGVDTVAFRPDGQQLATAGYGMGGDTSGTVWAFPSGEELAKLLHTENVDHLRYSPDGKRIALATLSTDGNDFGLLVWETENFRQQPMLKGPQRPIHGLAFSSDSKYVACGDLGGVVHIWRVSDGKVVQKLTKNRASVKTLCFSPDSQTLAVARSKWRNDFAVDRQTRTKVSDKGHIELIRDFTKPAQTTTVLVAQGEINALCFSPDGQWLLSGGREFPPGKEVSRDATVQLWKITEKKLYNKFKAHEHLTSMVLADKGRTLITGGNDTGIDGSIKVWLLPSDFYTRQFTPPNRTHD